MVVFWDADVRGQALAEVTENFRGLDNALFTLVQLFTFDSTLAAGALKDCCSDYSLPSQGVSGVPFGFLGPSVSPRKVSLQSIGHWCSIDPGSSCISWQCLGR